MAISDKEKNQLGRAQGIFGGGGVIKKTSQKGGICVKT